ncbi:hypothetical protein [Ornithinimicrobium sp. Y1694]|uniref:hypothetical protein n=1 Tax=Ornithinimicrobium sp. Y1694 TaxID=3418590 RepID=UPI003CEDFBC8
MSDRDVLTILDRAAAEAPRMHLEAGEVVRGGRRKVVRRRATGAGMAIGGLALAGAVWAGLGGSGLLGASQDGGPAGQPTTGVESEVDGSADGARADRQGPVPDRQGWLPAPEKVELDDRLALADGAAITLTVSNGEVMATDLDGGTFRTDLSMRGDGQVRTAMIGERPVVMVDGWTPSDAASLRVGVPGDPMQGAGAVDWQEPLDAAFVMVPDASGGERPFLALSVEGREALGEAFVGEELADGRVYQAVGVVAGESTVAGGGESAGPGALEGLSFSINADTLEVDGVARGGELLEQVNPQPWQPVGAWQDLDGATLVIGETGSVGPVVVVTEGAGDRVQVGQDQVTESGLVSSGGGRTFAIERVPAGTRVVGLARQDSQALADGIGNTWSFLGVTEQEHYVLDGGEAVVATDGTDRSVLLVSGRAVGGTDEGGLGDGELPRATGVDQEAVAYLIDDRTAMVVALVSDPTQADPVLSNGATSPEGGTQTQRPAPGRPALVFSMVRVPEGVDLTREDLSTYVSGFDQDGDGVVDLRLQG